MALSEVDKVVVSNRKALIGKYGAAGSSAIYEALQRLVAADLVHRGIKTVIVDLDDPVQMGRAGGSAVISAADERGAKEAVDAVAAKWNPDFILLLDGPDVIPHLKLDQVRGLADDDPAIESDLPYACQAAYSQTASDFLAVTRVVSRLPAAGGKPDAAKMVGMIDSAAAHVPRDAAAYSSYFSICALPWQQSTQLSLKAIFGDHQALQLCPIAGHAAIDAALPNLTHYINCHGAPVDHRFYGQDDEGYPIAMESSLVEPHVAPGTLVVAECCYGAQMYDGSFGNGPPMALSYMARGALGFLGSTCIAYGSATTNGQADLLTRFFLDAVLKGASIGRGFLQARQRFISTQVMASPANLKTLAQFVLFGDPSLEAVKPTAEAKQKTILDAVDDESGRKSRRIILKSLGSAVASATTYPGRPAKPTDRMIERVRDIAKQRGFSNEPVILSVSGGAGYRAAAKTANARRMVAITVEKHHPTQDLTTGFQSARFRVLTTHILGDGITAVEECESR